MNTPSGISFLPEQSILEALEAQVQDALKSLDMSSLQVLGFGESTIVLRLNTPSGALACKRFPPIRHREDALAHKRIISDYVKVLSERGVATLESACMTTEAKDGWTVLYLIQPLVDASRIGPEYFRSLNDETTHGKFELLLNLIEGSVNNDVAPDGQLSNWAFLDDGIYYIDVSTPFMRDAEGELQMNLTAVYEAVFGGIMLPLRPYFKRKMPTVFDSYFSVRGQLIDLLANLRKEQMDELIAPLMQQANKHLSFDPPITIEDVKAYYNEDADVYELLMRLYRANRWFHRHVLRKTYPSFIPPQIIRNKF